MGRNRRKESSAENGQHKYREGKVPDPPGVITWHAGSGVEGGTKCAVQPTSAQTLKWPGTIFL